MAELIDWETKPEFILAKSMALYEIITGESSVKNIDCLPVIRYSVYFLEAMRLNFGKHKYNFISEDKRGLVSDSLRDALAGFKSVKLISDAREYILHDSTNGTTEKTGRLLIESRSSIDSGYTQKEYLGAMANAHFLRVNNVGDDDSILYVLKHNTYFTNNAGNARALSSAKSLMRR